jgi:hypothetical protein
MKRCLAGTEKTKRGCGKATCSFNQKCIFDNSKWQILITTDTIATWIKHGYGKGPFPAPLFKNFRSNPLIDAVQKTKFCLVFGSLCCCYFLRPLRNDGIQKAYALTGKNLSFCYRCCLSFDVCITSIYLGIVKLYPQSGWVCVSSLL